MEWLVHRHRSQWFDQTRACPRAGSVASGAKRRQPDSPLHPLVAVAEGSHANYLHATDERSPEWSGCGAHVSPQTVAALSFVVNVRDRTGSAGTVAPAHVKVVTEQAQPMSFAGFWG